MRGIVIVPGPGGKMDVLFPRITPLVAYLYISGREQLLKLDISGRSIGGGAIILDRKKAKELTDVFRRIVVVSCGESAWERMVEASGVTAPGVEFFCRLSPWIKLFFIFHRIGSD